MIYPLVTIALPTFNRVATFEKTLRSAIAQDYKNIEILISDNASTDKTEDLCNQLKNKFPNIVYFRQKDNIGAEKNFNFLLEKATGEYFMWLGDDDWLDSNYISSCITKFYDDPQAAIVAGTPKYYIGEHFIYDGLIMNINNSSASKRVIKYFKEVKHNGIFYGLMRTDDIRQKPFRNCLGNDLLFVASFVFAGRVYTLNSSSVHRRRGGVSSQNKKLVKSMGLPWFDAWFPRLAVAKNVFSYIMTDNSFDRLPTIKRFGLAVQCVVLAGGRKIASVICPTRFVEQSYKKLTR